MGDSDRKEVTAGSPNDGQSGESNAEPRSELAVTLSIAVGAFILLLPIVIWLCIAVF